MPERPRKLAFDRPLRDRTRVPDAQLVVFSVTMAALATIIALPFAVLIAWALSRRRFPGRSAIETGLSLPLVLPPTATGLVLLELFRRDGLLGSVLARLGFDVAFTWRGVLLAGAVMGFPLIVRSARSAFDAVDPRLLAMARSLGEPPVRGLFRVALPIAWRGISAGALLGFARALGEFGATILIAGNIPGRTQTLSLAIFERVQAGQDRSAWGLVAITVLMAFGAIWLTERLAEKRA